MAIYQCTIETCTVAEHGKIHYLPNLPANIIYLVIFALLFFLHLGLGARYRTWGFTIPIIMGAACEVIGYGGRIMGRSDPFSLNPFLVYLVPLTIGPAFLTASIYLCLGRIVTVYGRIHSRLAPRTYTIVFVTFDLVSLILQSIGGAMAAQSVTQSQLDNGVHVMMAGLIWQVVSIVLFLIVWTDFVLARRRAVASGMGSGNGNVQFDGLIGSEGFTYFQWGKVIGRITYLYSHHRFTDILYPTALLASTLLILIRCIFRVSELSGGFNGSEANNEVEFMILEGPMIFIATGLMAAFHPGRAFKGLWGVTGWRGGNVNGGRTEHSGDVTEVEGRGDFAGKV
ncbi:hypothetical protein HKX48_008739 [Thoreauomyces humboldtii]|nr:hypothetical protein HKX48_008739 [Thoreauomyces humboldtii]